MSPRYDTFIMFAAVYDDVTDAEADYEAVKDLYRASDLIDTFDAAVIGKNADERVKIHKKHEQPTRHGGWVGAGWGLATGLAVALFPAAAIGGGLLAGTTIVGSGVGALAGHVMGGMSRSDLKELGENLDAGQAGLLVAAASDLSDDVARALTRAEDVVSRQASIDAEVLADELEEAKAGA
jgi:uncharacterized membrane protein